MSSLTYKQAIEKAVDIVDWKNGIDEGHDDNERNDVVIAMLQNMFPNESQNIETDLHAAVEERKAEPDPDAELKEHIAFVDQEELNKPVP
jgi:hypothetical protein